MKVLITGATGLVGPYIVRTLIQQGLEVRGLVRSPDKLRDQLGDLFELIECLPYNIMEPIPLKTLDGCDIVIHNAGATKALSPKQFHLINTGGTVKLLKSIVEHGGVKRFIFISSLAAGNSSYAPMPERKCGSPVSFYGMSKSAAESTVDNLLKGSGVNYTILRPGAVWGPGDAEFTDLYKLIGLGIIPRLSWGDNPISMIHVRDLASAVVYLMLHQDLGYKTISVAHEQEVTVASFISTIQKVLNPKYTVDVSIPNWILEGFAWSSELFAKLTGKPAMITPSKLNELRSPWCPDLTALKRTGFQTKISLEEGLKELLLSK